MKCKSWSNKINTFVVRRLKSIKINGTQQQSVTGTTAAAAANATATTPQTVTAAAAAANTSSSTSALAAATVNATNTTTTAQQTNSTKEELQAASLVDAEPQQQLTASKISDSLASSSSSLSLSLSSSQQTMPAMPKEKAATAVSALNETNFAELKLKELSVVAAAMATATAATTMAAASSRLHQHQHQHHHNHNHHTHHNQYQQQQQQQPTCGCGAASAFDTTAATTTTNSNNNNNNGTLMLISSGSRFISNGHSSPLAAAAAAQMYNNSCSNNSRTTCCRSNQSSLNTTQLQQQQQQQQTQQNLTVEGIAAGSSSVSSIGNSNGSSAAAAEAAPAAGPPSRSPNDFIFGRYIGEGSFSMVYLAVDIHTRKEYAIKVCEKRHILRERKQEYIRREREVMHMMTNVPGFVNLSCTFQDKRSLYFVMTYAKKGDLLPYINKVGSFDVDCTRHYAAELLLACEHMHRRNVVHRDLKPENILLDEDMHTLIADFGSAKIMTAKERAQAAASLGNKMRRVTARSSDEDEIAEQHYGQQESDDDEEVDDSEDDDEGLEGPDDSTGSDEVDAVRPGQPQLRTQQHQRRSRQRYHRKRKGSFVGTAQYVSPEVLQNVIITPAADLWALGCIVYQMISGLPPFRGSNDYVIFKEILACNVDFPEGFDKDAEDLVRRLLKINAAERLGAQDEFGYYDSIRAHPFFTGINWETLRNQTPPQIYPYLPGVSKDEEFRSNYRVPENLEPGLDERQITRLLGMELGVVGSDGSDNGAASGNSTLLSSPCNYANSDSNRILFTKKTAAAAKNSFDLSMEEKMKRREQQKSDKWHVFADDEVILKKGFINKRKGLFARKRMLLLTTGPRLIYIDPVQMIKKGEIPWSPELRVEAKNFKIFFVHTPNRTYYLDDPEGYSLEWVDAIEKMRKLTYTEQHNATTATTSTSTATVQSKNNSSSSGNSPINIIKPTNSTTSSTTTNAKQQNNSLFGGGSSSPTPTPAASTARSANIKSTYAATAAVTSTAFAALCKKTSSN